MYLSERFHDQANSLSLVNSSPAPRIGRGMMPAIAPTKSVSDPETASAKPRRRGMILTEQGWQKLLQAEVLHNCFGKRYTFEELSKKTLLVPRTVCRILGRETGVDKRTLNIFFNAFNLQLEQSDYTAAVSNRHKGIARPQAEVKCSSLLLVGSEELTHLKQRIIADCYRLAVLLGCDRAAQTALTIKLSPETLPQIAIDIYQHYDLHFFDKNQ